MPIISNFPTGGADPERYATITFYDWDDTLIGSIAVKKGADASDAVAAFEDAHKADTFDEGSQYYSSDATKPLTNKKGYSFEGVWLDYGSDVRTHYGVTNNSDTTIAQPAGVSFENVTEDMVVKACYGSNSECATETAASRHYTTEVVGYNRQGTSATYPVMIRVRRENKEGQGVPRLSTAVVRIILRPTESSTAVYSFIPIKNTDDQIIECMMHFTMESLTINLIDAYGASNFATSGVKSSNLIIRKGTAEEKDGFIFWGTLRSVNDAVAPGGTIGNVVAAALKTNLGMTVATSTAAKLRTWIQTAWRTKNGADYETKDPSEYVDLTWEEIQYAVQNEGALLPEIQSLANASWEQIDAVSRAGLAPTYWNVGDEKDIVVNGETLTLAIMGFNHDDITGGGKAGITFGLKNLMAATRAMNSTDTNVGGFTGSEMYTWLQGELLSGLPTDLQSVLKFVDKKTSAGNKSTTINTDSMKIFLFSEIEIFGDVSYSVEGEGTQYPYFSTVSGRAKWLSNGSGSAYFWWERSPYVDYSTIFGCVGSDGLVYPNSANNSVGVCFGFCV